MRKMTNMEDRQSDSFREAVANRPEAKDRKKKKKQVDKDLLKSAMGISNIGEGIEHAAKAYVAAKGKK